MGLPSEFYNTESVLTLAGGSGIVTISTNAVNYAFNLNPKYSALFFSLLVSVLGLLLQKNFTIVDILIGFFNVFLIYATSIGISQITGKRKIETSATKIFSIQSYKKEEKCFFIKWY